MLQDLDPTRSVSSEILYEVRSDSRCTVLQLSWRSGFSASGSGFRIYGLCIFPSGWLRARIYVLLGMADVFFGEGLRDVAEGCGLHVSQGVCLALVIGMMSS